MLFLIFGQYKVFATQFTLHGGFQFWINKFLEDGAYPFMIPVLRGFVLPHATAIAFLVAYGELAIGVALVIGVWVRPASLFGFLYMLSLLFSSNYPGAHAPLWQYFGASLDHSVLALLLCRVLGWRRNRRVVACNGKEVKLHLNVHQPGPHRVSVLDGTTPAGLTTQCATGLRTAVLRSSPAITR